MKILPIAFAILLACFIQPANAQTQAAFITAKDAESIMGEPATLLEHNTSTTKGVIKNVYTYTSTTKANPVRNLYALMFTYPDTTTPINNYLGMKTGNQTHQGFAIVTGCGDEAFIQTDGSNFYTMVVRKGAKMLQFKLNKVSAKSSYRVFEEVGRKIVREM